jgi:hypothetical protein
LRTKSNRIGQPSDAGTAIKAAVKTRLDEAFGRTPRIPVAPLRNCSAKLIGQPGKGAPAISIDNLGNPDIGFA